MVCSGVLVEFKMRLWHPGRAHRQPGTPPPWPPARSSSHPPNCAPTVWRGGRAAGRPLSRASPCADGSGDSDALYDSDDSPADSGGSDDSVGQPTPIAPPPHTHTELAQLFVATPARNAAGLPVRSPAGPVESVCTGLAPACSSCAVFWRCAEPRARPDSPNFAPMATYPCVLPVLSRCVVNLTPRPNACAPFRCVAAFACVLVASGEGSGAEGAFKPSSRRQVLEKVGLKLYYSVQGLGGKGRFKLEGSIPR
jgi:hypothetical protein